MVLSSLADRLRIQPMLIRCHAPTHVLHERINRRQDESKDASEADLSVLKWQQSHFDPIEDGERFTVLEINTHAPNALDEALSRLLQA